MTPLLAAVHVVAGVLLSGGPAPKPLAVARNSGCDYLTVSGTYAFVRTGLKIAKGSAAPTPIASVGYVVYDSDNLTATIHMKTNLNGTSQDSGWTADTPLTDPAVFDYRVQADCTFQLFPHPIPANGPKATGGGVISATGPVSPVPKTLAVPPMADGIALRGPNGKAFELLLVTAGSNVLTIDAKRIPDLTP